MHKPILAKELEQLFRTLDKRLITGFYNYSIPPAKFNIIAYGGTALGLRGLKKISKDIDILIDLLSVEKISSTKDQENFTKRIQNFIKEHFDGSEGVGADVTYDHLGDWNILGLDFGKQLLNDSFRCFNLYSLDLLDICITKLARYDIYDITDCKNIFEQLRPSQLDLEKRFEKYIKHLRKPKKEATIRSNFELMKKALSQN